DPRRLATAALAAAVGAARRWPLGAQSAVVAVARQAARQPAPQPGAGGDDRAVRARLAACAARAGLDAVGTVDVAGGTADGRPDGAGRQAAGAALARAPAAPRPGRRPRPGPDHAGCGLPAVRGVLQPRRDRADAVADAGLAPADAAVEPVERGREDPRQRAGGVAALDVVRSGVRARHRVRAGAPASGIVAGGRAAAGPVAAVAVAGVVDRASARTQGERAVGLAARVPRPPV